MCARLVSLPQIFNISNKHRSRFRAQQKGEKSNKRLGAKSNISVNKDPEFILQDSGLVLLILFQVNKNTN